MLDNPEFDCGVGNKIQTSKISQTSQASQTSKTSKSGKTIT